MFYSTITEPAKKLKALRIKSIDEIPLNSKVCLYGAGDGGGNFLRLLSKARRDIEIKCFIDDFKAGERDGIKIVPLEEAISSRNEYELILVTSTYQREVISNLARNGVDKYAVVNPKLYFDFQIFDDDDLKRCGPDIKRARDLLATKEDRSLYDMIVRMRRIDFRPENISGSFLRSVEAFNGEYIDFIKRERISTVIEGGIGDGSNSVIFLDLFPKSIIYGFDPFTEAYLKGGHRVNLEGSGRIKRYPYALWDRCQDINLLVNRYNYQGARIVKGREGYGRLKNVKAVSVDHFVRKNNIKKVDYIKLDIEGAEMKALEGAKNTLASHRPQLAVCVYHKKEDLFEIPIFLAKVLKDYVYRIGHYTTSLWGTVLYAIPGECYKKTAFADVYTHARR